MRARRNVNLSPQGTFKWRLPPGESIVHEFLASLAFLCALAVPDVFSGSPDKFRRDPAGQNQN
jgi:hypothetical protein